MKPILVITSLMLCLFTYSQRITNDFFVFESILSNDSVYNSFEKKANLIKESGFNGIEIFELDQFNEKFNAILKLGFKPSSLYTKLDLDEPELDPRLVDAIKMLKGLGTIICPYIIKKMVYPCTPEIKRLIKLQFTYSESCQIWQMNQVSKLPYIPI